ncbi:sigma-70 family RNA polymerase sigma factor [Paraburkholderia sp. IW21]|uniref:sigma-70 family RNA polymerase sigma factor n=1 Tax=Paraburkholderia sp. IW21 TaxID=3242488 RepID=UPI003522C666
MTLDCIDAHASPDLADAGTSPSALWREFADTQSIAAREALFLRYLPYARAVAAQMFASRHRDDVEFKDFQQLAFIGLLESIDRFDPVREVSFETFCTPRLKGSVLDGVEKLTDGQEQVSFMRRARRERIASLKTADADNVTVLDTFQLLAHLTAGLAIGYMLDDTGMLADSADRRASFSTPYQGVAWRQTRERLLAAVSQLHDRSRKIIQYHYFNGLTFEQIGELTGVSKGRISQIHRATLIELRERLGAAQQMYLKG